jgi:hypothetical protein
MLQERILTYSEEAELRGVEKGREEGKKDMASKLLNSGVAPLSDRNEDDEPLSEEDLEALDRADDEIVAGHFYTLDEFNRKMASLP